MPRTIQMIMMDRIARAQGAAVGFRNKEGSTTYIAAEEKGYRLSTYPDGTIEKQIPDEHLPDWIQVMTRFFSETKYQVILDTAEFENDDYQEFLKEHKITGELWEVNGGAVAYRYVADDWRHLAKLIVRHFDSGWPEDIEGFIDSITEVR